MDSSKTKSLKIESLIEDEKSLRDCNVYSKKNIMISLFYNIMSNSYKYTENIIPFTKEESYFSRPSYRKTFSNDRSFDDITIRNSWKSRHNR